MPEPELELIATRTREIYARNAARFDAERHKILIERQWLDRFTALLPERGCILDAGCGSGEPIARHLIERHYRVTGIDFAEPMLEICRGRFPQARWIEADMRTLSLGEQFNGIVAWHSFFHLRPNEQRGALARFADHLAPGGALMITVGPTAGEVTGHVGDDIVYHASLAPEAYEELLADLDIAVIDFVAEDPRCDGATVLLAARK